MRAQAMKEGTLHQIGVVTINVDRVTKSRLKVLAGDTPLCQKVKELVDMAEGVKPGGGFMAPLPGQEALVSSNTMASLSIKLDKLLQLGGPLPSTNYTPDMLNADIKSVLVRLEAHLTKEREIRLASPELGLAANTT